jgi:hypothetical protein
MGFEDGCGIPQPPRQWHDRRIESNPAFLTASATASAMATPTQKVGQHWYIKFPESDQSHRVFEVRIVEITKKTIMFYGISTRYEISDIKFIELVKDAESVESK